MQNNAYQCVHVYVHVWACVFFVGQSDVSSRASFSPKVTIVVQSGMLYCKKRVFVKIVYMFPKVIKIIVGLLNHINPSAGGIVMGLSRLISVIIMSQK